MPTTKPRHVITETDLVRRALDEAAVRWPADSEQRSRLLLRLVEEGYRSIAEERDKRNATRRETIRSSAGVATGAYGDDYLTRLREEWPA